MAICKLLEVVRSHIVKLPIGGPSPLSLWVPHTHSAPHSAPHSLTAPHSLCTSELELLQECALEGLAAAGLVQRESISHPTQLHHGIAGSEAVPPAGISFIVPNPDKMTEVGVKPERRRK